MSLFVKKMIGLMYIIAIISCVVALSSTIIFIFDINGSKGLMPLIFFCLMTYFLLLYSIKVLQDSFNKRYKKIFIFSPNLILGIVSGIIFFLSLFVFWL